jgi:hypothetical protein
MLLTEEAGRQRPSHLVSSCQDALRVVHRMSATDACERVAQTFQVVTRALNCKGQAGA